MVCSQGFAVVPHPGVSNMEEVGTYAALAKLTGIESPQEQSRRIESAVEAYNSGVITADELRKVIGMPPADAPLHHPLCPVNPGPCECGNPATLTVTITDGNGCSGERWEMPAAWLYPPVNAKAAQWAASVTFPPVADEPLTVEAKS